MWLLTNLIGHAWANNMLVDGPMNHGFCCISYTEMCPSSHMRLFPTITNQQTLSVSTKNQNIEYPVSAFTVMYSTPPTSSQQPKIYPIVPSKVQRTPARLSERESNRKVSLWGHKDLIWIFSNYIAWISVSFQDKKKYLERLRRSKINTQIKTMYDLVFKMSGEVSLFQIDTFFVSSHWFKPWS